MLTVVIISALEDLGQTADGVTARGSTTKGGVLAARNLLICDMLQSETS